MSRQWTEAGGTVEVVRGQNEVASKIAGFISRASEDIDIYSGQNGMVIALQMSKLKRFQDAPRKRLRLRYLTEITKENLPFAKMLSNLTKLRLEGLASIELRHLDGVAGNFALSDSGEYISVPAVQRGSPIKEMIYSDAPSLASEHRYLFDTVWERAVSAESRMRELGEKAAPSGTRLLSGELEVVSEIVAMVDPADRLVVCMTTDGLRAVLESLAEPLLLASSGDATAKFGGIRWLTSVGDQDGEIVEALARLGVETRHTNKLPVLSFVCGRSKTLASIESPGKKTLFQNVLSSKDPTYASHFQMLFEEMWKDGVDARKRLDEITSGAEHSIVRVIENPQESLRVAWDLLGSSREILLMFSTPRAFLRQVGAGAFERLKSILEATRPSVTILIPYDPKVTPILERVRNEVPSVDFRVINGSLKTKISILIADRSKTLVLETVDDDSDELLKALGTATYAESQPLSASYAAIFENIRKQTDMYDQLKLHEKLQSDFVNIAAHELRTPVQAIINYAELATTDVEKKEEYYARLLRNVTRLQKLTEEILDAARIDGGTLRLNKERFEINAMVEAAVEELRIGGTAKGVDLVILPSGTTMAEGDRGRLSQVVSNLLSNAAKFTEAGSITVSVRARARDNVVRITVADTGTGIDPSIVPRLFSRFVAKSQSGTGLGLYISKNIVEEHGGRIWVEKNGWEGGGAAVAFEIPISQDLPANIKRN